MTSGLIPVPKRTLTPAQYGEPAYVPRCFLDSFHHSHSTLDPWVSRGIRHCTVIGMMLMTSPWPSHLGAMLTNTSRSLGRLRSGRANRVRQRNLY